MGDYRLPFPEDTFDFVFSASVLEHVQNTADALREIHRVLRPGGTSLHCFPSRYRPIEPHVFVPLATIFRGLKYLEFWARLGIRNSFQQNMTPSEVAKANYDYLRTSTNYLPESQLQTLAARLFRQVSFEEHAYIRFGYGRLRHLKHVPFVTGIVRTFHEKVLLLRK